MNDLSLTDGWDATLYESYTAMRLIIALQKSSLCLPFMSCASSAGEAQTLSSASAVVTKNSSNQHGSDQIISVEIHRPSVLLSLYILGSLC